MLPVVDGAASHVTTVNSSENLFFNNEQKFLSKISFLIKVIFLIGLISFKSTETITFLLSLEKTFSTII